MLVYPIAFGKDVHFAGGYVHSYEYIFKNYTFRDGTPCGKLMTDE